MSSSVVSLHPRVLVLHEDVEPARLEALVGQVRRHGITVPVAVARLADTHLVLDGAHRATAARRLGLAAVPVRLVDVSGLRYVGGWTHIVEDPLCQDALARVQRDGRDAAGPRVAVVRSAGTLVEHRAVDDTPAAVMRAFRQVADCYGWASYRRERLPDAPGVAVGAAQITWELPQLPALVALVSTHGRLPAGVTRFDLDLEPPPIATPSLEIDPLTPPISARGDHGTLSARRTCVRSAS